MTGALGASMAVSGSASSSLRKPVSSAEPGSNSAAAAMSHEMSV